MASDPFYSNIFKKEKRVLEYREIIKKKSGGESENNRLLGVLLNKSND